jgi:Subtilase family
VRALVPLLAAAAALAGGGPATARLLPERAAEPDVLIQLDRAHRDTAAPLLRARGATRISEELGVWRLRTAAADTLLPSLRGVSHVSPDRKAIALTHLTAGDPLSADPWYLAAVGATTVEPPGPGRAVAIVDSGLDSRHEEFLSREDTVLLDDQSIFESEEDFHGTAVSSLAAAPANGVGLVGVYPRARLLSWDDHGTTLGGIVGGLDTSSEGQGAVINLSLGFGSSDPLLEQAVALAVRRGSIVVAAAGNDRERGSPAIWPARLPHVLTVAATDRSNRVAYFSSSSPGMDLAAPGLGVPVAVPNVFSDDGSGYDALDGTSFAAPIVTAAAAWVWTVRPRLDRTQLAELLRLSARDIGQPGYDHNSGYGLLNIPNALARPTPVADAQEPNEDVAYVKPRSMFRDGNAPVTTAARRDSSVRARLADTDDPRDVYRIWIPRGATATVRVTPDQNVDLRVWGPKTTSVRATRAARARDVVARSAAADSSVEVLRVRNTRAAAYFYVETFLGARTTSARYTLSVATRP